MRANARIIDIKDNVAVVTEPVNRNDTVCYGEGQTLAALDDIPIYHKVALEDIEKGRDVFKYGQIIGVATKDIRKGMHVHMHNMKSKEERS